jgi:hypothetical protein
MKGAAIQEFNNALFTSEILSLSDAPRNVVYWESPRLTTEYPIDGRPKGADRGICKIVNGIAAVRFIDKRILDYPDTLEMSGGLYGEYAGISGVIQQIAFTQDYTPLLTQMYASNGAIAFPQLSTFANIAPNIFMRIVFARRDFARRGIPPLPIKVSITGSLLAMAPR